MPFSEISDKSTVYQRLQKWIFSGEIPPGTKLAERELAEELGVSRIPVRESIRQMVAHGLLVGGEKWEGVRTRVYTHEEVRQLSEFREIFEGGSAKAAAANATEVDLTRMDMICNEEDGEVGNYGSERWAQLDHHFHEVLAEASHNERLIHCLKHMLAECYYVFYLRPSRVRPKKPSPEEAVALMARVVEDHRTLVAAIRAGDGDLAEKIAQAHIWAGGRRAAQEMIALDLVK
jgi:DNA-binding GntR family transcriptional regulator